MSREVMLSSCSSLFEEFEYPIGRSKVSSELKDVTLLLADGEANLGELIAEIETETLESREDIEAELHNVLPREAVGEPYQSEGEG